MGNEYVAITKYGRTLVKKSKEKQFQLVFEPRIKTSEGIRKPEIPVYNYDVSVLIEVTVTGESFHHW